MSDPAHYKCIQWQWKVRSHCRDKTLPHKVHIIDSIIEGEMFVIKSSLEIDDCEAPIMRSNAVYSANPEWTWMLA